MGNEKVVFWNGSFVNTDIEEVSFPFEERAFQFGDGIYEVIRIYNGNYYTLEEHINRLFTSAQEIKLDIPYTKGQLMGVLESLVSRNDFGDDGYVYMQISRGSAPRDHTFPVHVEGNIVAYIMKKPRPKELIKTGVSTILTEDQRWLRCNIKSLNLLPNVIAKTEATEHDCFEAIQVRTIGEEPYVTEGSASNIFMVKDGTVITHPANNFILNGITRMKVREFCEKLTIPYLEKEVTLKEIGEMDELFLTSTTAEIIPITKVVPSKFSPMNTEFPVGDITRSLQEEYENDIKVN